MTSGTFSLDGGTWDVDNNVWLLGDDAEVLVVDAPHDADDIVAAVATGAPVLLHAGDRELWDRVHPDRAPDGELTDGQQLTVAGAVVTVLHTPGHSPGSVSFSVPALHVLFSGDTLFAGGPGATGRSFSDFPTIVTSIRDRLLTLPPDTVVHTGHGDDTTVGAEVPHLPEGLDRSPAPWPRD